MGEGGGEGELKFIFYIIELEWTEDSLGLNENQQQKQFQDSLSKDSIKRRKDRMLTTQTTQINQV